MVMMMMIINNAETQPEDVYISLLEPFPDSDEPFDPK